MVSVFSSQNKCIVICEYFNDCIEMEIWAHNEEEMLLDGYNSIYFKLEKKISWYKIVQKCIVKLNHLEALVFLLLFGSYWIVKKKTF